MTQADAWAALADRFVRGHYGTIRGQVRTYVIDAHLRAHLPSAPAALVDVGGGAGNQSIPLAGAGYQVTIVDPSAAMLALAEDRLAAEPRELAARVRLVHASAQTASATLGGERFAGVLCHGVIMYVDDPRPFTAVVAELAQPGGIVSLVAKNAECLAVRPALEGRWADALAAFGANRQINGLGVDTRADTVDGLTGFLAEFGVDPVAWYGVRLFTDGWIAAGPPGDSATGGGDVWVGDSRAERGSSSGGALEDIVAVELAASRRDPYRQLSRLFHLIGRRRVAG